MRPIISAPDDGTDHGSLAAEQAGAAEHGRGDHRKLVALAELESARVQATRIEHPRHAAATLETISTRSLMEACRRRVIARRGLVAAGRQDSAAEGRARSSAMADNAEDHGPDQQARHRPDIAAAEECAEGTSTIGIDRVSLIHMATPRAMPIIASVVRNEGIPIRVVISR